MGCYHDVQRRVNRHDAAWSPGRAADDRQRRSHGQGAMPRRVRLNDQLDEAATRRKRRRCRRVEVKM